MLLVCFIASSPELDPSFNPIVEGIVTTRMLPFVHSVLIEDCTCFERDRSIDRWIDRLSSLEAIYGIWDQKVSWEVSPWDGGRMVHTAWGDL